MFQRKQSQVDVSRASLFRPLPRLRGAHNDCALENSARCGDGSLGLCFGTTSAINMTVRTIKPVAIIMMKKRCILANASLRR